MRPLYSAMLAGAWLAAGACTAGWKNAKERDAHPRLFQSRSVARGQFSFSAFMFTGGLAALPAGVADGYANDWRRTLESDPLPCTESGEFERWNWCELGERPR